MGDAPEPPAPAEPEHDFVPVLTWLSCVTVAIWVFGYLTDAGGFETGSQPSTRLPLPFRMWLLHWPAIVSGLIVGTGVALQINRRQKR